MEQHFTQAVLSLICKQRLLEIEPYINKQERIVDAEIKEWKPMFDQLVKDADYFYNKHNGNQEIEKRINKIMIETYNDLGWLGKKLYKVKFGIPKEKYLSEKQVLKDVVSELNLKDIKHRMEHTPVYIICQTIHDYSYFNSHNSVISYDTAGNGSIIISLSSESKKILNSLYSLKKEIVDFKDNIHGWADYITVDSEFMKHIQIKIDELTGESA